MADNSKFVLRWEIKNATAVHAAGKAESKVFNEGGFEWNIKMERGGQAQSKFTLRCGLDKNRNWKCEGKVAQRVLYVDGRFSDRDDEKFVFNDDTILWSPQIFFYWDVLIRPLLNANDTVTFEFTIQIISSDRGVVVSMFDAPNNKSNVILKIGEEKLHVSKEYLAVHSPVFDTLFFGDFVEKGKEEVELNDIVYEEFLDLLNIVYVQALGMTDRSVPHVLKLADRFQIKHVVDLAHNFLSLSSGFDTVQKLLMADQYRLAELKNHCLNSLKSFDDWAEQLEAHPEANFSDEMKIAIYDRLLELKRQRSTTN